jgi:hypothetical protein
MNIHQNSFQIVHSRYATEALTVARRNGMTMRVVGQGDVPLEPFYLDEWWYSLVTAESTIPAEGVRRIETLVKAGIPMKGLVIRHEAPRLLTAPKEEKQVKRKRADTYVAFEALPLLATILGALGAVLAVFGYIFVMAIHLDPALIAVLPDGTYLEVLTWYE